VANIARQALQNLDKMTDQEKQEVGELAKAAL